MPKQGREKTKIDLQPMLRIKNSAISWLNDFKPINLILSVRLTLEIKES